MGDLFAIALIDAAIIGAAAVGLATAYATSDVLNQRHSLHRPVTQAKGFYACYAALIALAAALVLIPRVPLGLLTLGVQVLAGVLLPSAVVFLAILCNDKAVLGPWVNGRKLNIVTGVIIWVLVILSVILTASVLFPAITGSQILAVMVVGTVSGLVLGAFLLVQGRRHRHEVRVDDVLAETLHRDTWRMPPLARLARPAMSRASASSGSSRCAATSSSHWPWSSSRSSRWRSSDRGGAERDRGRHSCQGCPDTVR